MKHSESDSDFDSDNSFPEYPPSKNVIEKQIERLSNPFGLNSEEYRMRYRRGKKKNKNRGGNREAERRSSERPHADMTTERSITSEAVSRSLADSRERAAIFNNMSALNDEDTNQHPLNPLNGRSRSNALYIGQGRGIQGRGEHGEAERRSSEED